MVSPVGRSYYHRFTTHSARPIALMDAHEKAGTLHRDVALGNIILYRPRKEMERMGYLIDRELCCKLNKVTIRRRVLTVRPNKFDPK